MPRVTRAFPIPRGGSFAGAELAGSVGGGSVAANHQV